MEIPFLRVYPLGEVKVVKIARAGRIEDLAHKFLRSGGRYMIKYHPITPGEPNVEMVAVIPSPASVQGHIRICEAWCHDDPALPIAIDQLVIDSVAQGRRASVH